VTRALSCESGRLVLLLSAQDKQYMRRALELAVRGRGRVEPNPAVGAVIVARETVIAEGYHARFGGPHAEVVALRKAGRKAAGATVYVTLEPCCHHGKTPPCTEALIRAGVARVVCATADPFGEVHGKGFKALRRAGIKVTTGVLAAEARELNAAYFKLRSTGLPLVIAKWAMSLDGKIATATGDSRWISSPASRRRVHELRSITDAVVIGITTALVDDPRLTARLGKKKPARQPTRIVLDSKLRIPIGALVVKTAKEVPTIIATLAPAARRRAAKVRQLTRAACEVLRLPAKAGRPDIRALVTELGRRQFSRVLIEGGAAVLGSAFSAGIVDRVMVFIAPKIIGEGPSAAAGLSLATIKDSLALKQIKIARALDDLLIEGRLGDF